MPPKVKPVAPGASKKTEAKKKEKIIEDKTFGLKNKKGAKQQKFIQQVQHQVKTGGVRKAEELKKGEPSKKDEKKKEQAELNQLFKPVTTQKVEKGADPKSVLCAFYKQGHCGKGDKCKFSHDLTLERKAEKRSVYVDMRDDGDTMENWDEAKLKQVVEKKHAEADSKLKTEIICKFFLDALERNKYGWFWECPNGTSCIYRHALPSGFVLNKDKKKEDRKDEISIEDLVETQLSGREMFTFNPEMATQDENDDEEGEMAYDTSNLPREDDEAEVVTVRELTLESLALVAQECDGTGTVSDSSRRPGEPYSNDINDKIEGAIGGNDVDATNHIDDSVIPIDENLFMDEDDDGMDEDDEDMENGDS